MYPFLRGSLASYYINVLNRKHEADIKKRLEWYSNFSIYETITSGTDETTFSKKRHLLQLPSFAWNGIKNRRLHRKVWKSRCLLTFNNHLAWNVLQLLREFEINFSSLSWKNEYFSIMIRLIFLRLGARRIILVNIFINFIIILYISNFITSRTHEMSYKQHHSNEYCEIRNKYVDKRRWCPTHAKSVYKLSH